MGKVNVNKIDLNKIKNKFIEMNNEKGILGLALVEEIEFQKETLTKMRKEINESGLVSEYSCYKRSNPIIAGYNAMIKNYVHLIKQAVDLLPNDDYVIDDNFEDDEL